MSVNLVSNSATRSTLIEYAGVLVDLDKIVTEYSKTAADDLKVQKARTLAGLLYVLRDINRMGLAGTSELMDLSSSILTRSQPLMAVMDNNTSASQIAQAMDNFVYTDLASETKTDLVNKALDPNQWGPLSVRDSISDFAFFEYYRKADATVTSTLGVLGNRIQISEKFLKALNNIYAGATWNPGEKFISTNGQLQDYIDENNQTTQWYYKFANEDQIGTKMSDGISQLQSMVDFGMLPANSIELKTANFILDKWNTSFAQGGYGAVANAESANRMWTDRQFKKVIEDGINGTSRLNEQAQLSISRILATYDFFTRSATNLVSRENDSTRDAARRIKEV